MADSKLPLGADAIQRKGWWRAHQWLLLRRISQLTILVLFLLGPLAGIWVVKGNLTSSLTLETLPLTDPFVLLQTLFAGHVPEATAITGAIIVLAFYLVVGGRVYCSWVCPVNVVTDAAAWLQEKLGIKANVVLPRNTRYWLIALVMVMALVSGTLVWELVNPVTVIHRGLVFGMGMAWMILLAIFLFDLIVSRRGWCGHLCPLGAFYSLLSVKAPLRVTAEAREKCDDCMECFAICPEPQVIRPALKGTWEETPLILSTQCTNCGRCIDICGKEVFHFTNRFQKNTTHSISNQKEVTP
jgi:ferredoxin-type protein NapH